LTHGAAQLKAAGSVEDLDARRSYALEDVIAAAHDPEPGEQGAFDLTGGQGKDRSTAATDATASTDAAEAETGISEVSRPRWSGRGVPRGKVLMYIHVGASAFWPDGNPPAATAEDAH